MADSTPHGPRALAAKAALADVPREPGVAKPDPILVADDYINLVFTRGIYGIAPFNVGTSFSFFNQLPSGR